MSSAGFVSDRRLLAHRSPGHPERPARLEAILDHLAATGLGRELVTIPPRAATRDEILAAHEAELLSRQESLAAEDGWADPDTYLRPNSPAIARLAAGSTIAALEAILEGTVDRAFAAVRPPGHHATADTMMGFCLLNNVAIAAAAARSRGLRRLAIVDWDVHHGNGTQAIFSTDPDLLYVSTHASPFYPGTGAVTDSGAGTARGTKVNLPLPPGSGDEAFKLAYERVAVPALERFEPELILVSCGWDAHVRDPLAPLQVTTAGYLEVAGQVVAAADRLCSGRLLAVLEGGYDLHALAWCTSGFCELLLARDPRLDPDPVSPAGEPDVGPVIAAARREAGLDQ